MPDGHGRQPEPYVDVELCFDPHQSQVALARSVAAEVATTGGGERAYVEKVRVVAGKLTAALLVLADREEPVRCAFRMLDAEIRLSVSVRGSPKPSAAAKSEHARLLDELVVPACTFTRPDENGCVQVVSDAFIPMGS
jgi:hypothetical protein